MPPLIGSAAAPTAPQPAGMIFGPDGRPFRSPSEMALPPWISFAGIFTGAARTYWHRGHDEALRHSREDALAMKRDPFLQGLLQERKLAVSSLPWHLEVPDEKNPRERQLRDTLTKILKGTRGLRRIVWALLEAIWYGRAGVEVTYRRDTIDGLDALCVDRWAPVNGDKLGWQHDERGGPDVPYVLINAAKEGELSGRGETVLTTIGGKGVLLKGSWRERFVLHRHEVQDADFFAGIEAGRIQGVGVRDGVYLLDWLRKEYLEWITTYLERVGMGVTVWNYDASNPNALTQAMKAAKDQDRRVNVFVPVWADGKGGVKGGLERIETPVAGVEALKTLVESFCEKKIERYVIGQEASASGEGSKGLGNEASAEFQQDTKVKIAQQDAVLLGETLTGSRDEPGLLSTIQYWTYARVDRALATLPVRWVFDVERAQSEKRLNAAKSCWEMGVDLKADEVRAAAGFSKPGDDDEVIQGKQDAQPGAGLPGTPGARSPGAVPGQPGAGPHQPPPAQPGGPQPPSPPAPKPPALPVPHARTGAPLRHAAHDASGEPRDAAGRWTAGGAGRVAGEKENAPRPPAGEKSSHRAWEARNEARDRTAEAIDRARDLGDLSERLGVSAAALADRTDELENGRATAASAVEAAGAHVALLTSAWDQAEAGFVAAGLTDEELAPLRQARAKAEAALGRKLSAYAAQAEKLGQAQAAFAAVEGSEPAEPVYPPEPEDAESPEWEAWDRETQRIEAAHEKAREKWETAYDRAEAKVVAQQDKLPDRFDDLDEAANDHDDRVSIAVEDTAEMGHSRLTDEEVADPEPDENDDDGPVRHARGLRDPATYVDALEFLTRRGMSEPEALAELRRIAGEM